MTVKRVLVTGAGGSPGVNFIQSLKEAPEPIEVVAADCNAHHLQWPPVTKKHLVPPCSHPEYIEALNEIIELEGINFVHPQPDVEVAILSRHRDQLHARTFFAKRSTIEILQDKALTGALWERAGIRSRPTLVIENGEDLCAAACRLGYPFWLRASTGAGARGSTLVENLDTAIHWIGYWRARGCDWQFIAEEYLPGRDYAWQSLWQDGELVTSMARERLEYIYPHLAPSGRTGTPIVAATVHDARLNEMGIRCVKAVDPKATGIFSVDLRESVEGEPVPTEINCGRFFTTSLFFTRAGINMPYLYVKMGFGEKIPAVAPVNPVPAGLLWLRHMDCPTVLIREEKIQCQTPWSKQSIAMSA